MWGHGNRVRGGGEGLWGRGNDQLLQGEVARCCNHSVHTNHYCHGQHWDQHPLINVILPKRDLSTEPDSHLSPLHSATSRSRVSRLFPLLLHSAGLSTSGRPFNPPVSVAEEQNYVGAGVCFTFNVGGAGDDFEGEERQEIRGASEVVQMGLGIAGGGIHVPRGLRDRVKELGGSEGLLPMRGQGT